MRIEKGLWLTLFNEYKQRILYQCATESITEEEFAVLWNAAGKAILRELLESKETSLEYRVRAQRT